MRLSRLLGASALSFLLLAGCEKEAPGSGSKPASSAASGAPASTAKGGTPVVTFEGGAITLEQLQSYIAQMNPQARPGAAASLQGVRREGAARHPRGDLRLLRSAQGRVRPARALALLAPAGACAPGQRRPGREEAEGPGAPGEGAQAPAAGLRCV